MGYAILDSIKSNIWWKNDSVINRVENATHVAVFLCVNQLFDKFSYVWFSVDHTSVKKSQIADDAIVWSTACLS